MPTCRRSTGATRVAPIGTAGASRPGRRPDDVVLAGAVHVDASTGARDALGSGAAVTRRANGCSSPTGPAEAEGVVMTYVYDRGAGTSSLVVLDARDVGAGPIARIRLPQRVPYGFHATWVPVTEA